MLGVGKIQRDRYRNGHSIRGVSRDLGVPHVTVRKVLRSEARSYPYDRRTPRRPKMGLWRSELNLILSEKEARPKRTGWNSGAAWEWRKIWSATAESTGCD